MWTGFAASFARFLAVAALIIQALMPGAMAAVSQRAPELMVYFCTTPGEAPGAHALGGDLAALLAEKEGGGEPADMAHDCAGCILGQPVPVPEMAALRAPVTARMAEAAPRFEVRFVARPRGPPLGARAPPILTGI